MYKPILIFLLLLFGCLQAKSDQDFSFIRTKYGITLYINSNDVKSQQKSWLDLENTLDSLLENLASVAPGRDTNQKIKILVHTKEHTSWLKNDTRVPYITLAYDTLNDVDFEFFKADSDSVVKTLIRNVYYKNRIVATYYEKGHIPVPLSIHSGNLKLPVVVGLKLVFNPDTAVNWREIKNLLKYGLSNKEEVKRDQKLLTVKFGFDKNFTTLATIISVDTFKIRKIRYGDLSTRLQTSLPGRLFIFFTFLGVMLTAWLTKQSLRTRKSVR